MATKKKPKTSSKKEIVINPKEDVDVAEKKDEVKFAVEEASGEMAAESETKEAEVEEKSEVEDAIKEEPEVSSETTQSSVPVVGEEQALSDATMQTFGQEELEEEVPLERDNRKILMIGTVLALMILAATGWLMYLRSELLRKEEVKVAEAVVEEVVATPTAEPTVTQLSKDQIILEILNGSSVSGLAGRTRTTFEELGYEVVSVGNGDDTTGNELYVRSGYEKRMQALLDDVESELEITSITGKLDSSTEAIARIVLGD